MPVPLAKKITEHAGVAQSVEQRTRNAKVVGSIPISGTSQTQKARIAAGLLFLTTDYD
jgi:hypothetical protein